MLPPNITLQQIKYFKLKEFKNQHVQERLSHEIFHEGYKALMREVPSLHLEKI